MDVCTLQRGFDLPKNRRSAGSAPLISSSGRVDSVADSIVSGPGVVTGRSGSIGKVYFVEDDFWPLNTTLYVKDFHGNDPRFVAYFLESLDLKGFASGVGVPTLNRNHVHNEPVSVPESLPEQKRIVAILDDAFAAIDQAIANTEKNLANARELFDSHLNAIFSNPGDDWRRSVLSDVCSGKITDGTHQTPKYFDAGYIFLSSRNVTSGVIDWSNVKYIDKCQHEAMQKRLSPEKGDILLAKNGTTGVAAIVDKDVDFDIYVSLALLRPSSEMSSRFLWYFINSPVAKKQFNKRLKGAGVPNLHLAEIREVEISYPQSTLKQRSIVARLDELRDGVLQLQTHYTQKLTALTELKQSLLQKAFAGELTADHAARDMA